ncbi:MAG: hypothetical protein EP330_04045 [Deltaproteobacteria bacterium]|nr:MAG: hypothetical protein EP330_04045 [Deltaproteobacteria bacterium]
MPSQSTRREADTSSPASTTSTTTDERFEQARGNGAAAADLSTSPENGLDGALGMAAGTPAKLHVYVDLEAQEISMWNPREAKKNLERGAVGHTWIALEYPDVSQIPDTVHPKHAGYLRQGGKYADSMGFWPGDEGYSTNPLNSYVSGRVKQPDTSHQGREKASQSYDLTHEEVGKVIDYAESKRGAKYSVYGYNCTSFAKESVEAAGKSAPSMSTLGIAMPNAAYEGIKKQQANGTEGTMVDDLDGLDFDALYEERYGNTAGQNPDADPTTQQREDAGHVKRT